MPAGRLTLVLGGARSGKSRWAEELAERAARERGEGGSVVYMATAEVGDEEMAARVRRHQARRPAHWRTVEAPRETARVLAGLPAGAGAVLVDCLTLFISNWLLAYEREHSGDALIDAVLARVAELVAAARQVPCDVIIVSNEVGGGVVPAYPLGRLFRDAAGLANQMVARAADRVYWVVAGIPIDARALDARRLEGCGLGFGEPEPGGTCGAGGPGSAGGEGGDGP